MELEENLPLGSSNSLSFPTNYFDQLRSKSFENPFSCVSGFSLAVNNGKHSCPMESQFTNSVPFSSLMTSKSYQDVQPSTHLSSKPNYSLEIFSWNAHSFSSPQKQLFISSKPQSILCVQESWGVNPQEILSLLPANLWSFSNCPRECRNGGGSTTFLNRQFHVQKEFKVNWDTKLLRLIVHNNKILWLCNCYLNEGSVRQIQTLFKSIKNYVPKNEWNRIIIIGDLNVNVSNLNEERTKLLLTLSKELGLKLIEPPSNTFSSSVNIFLIIFIASKLISLENL